MQTIALGSVVPSLIRTYVPVGIGSLLSLLVTTGVLPTPIPDEATAGVVTAVVAVTIGLYYTALRFLERHYPQLGLLLGSTQQPVDYAKGHQVVTGRVVAADAVTSRQATAGSAYQSKANSDL